MSNLKRKLQNWLLSKLFCVFTAEDFLQVKHTNREMTAGVVYFGKKPLEPRHAKELTIQAKTILQFEVFQKIESSMKWLASDMLYNKSKTAEDMIAGKMVLYTLDILRKKLEVIAKLEQ